MSIFHSRNICCGFLQIFCVAFCSGAVAKDLSSCSVPNVLSTQQEVYLSLFYFILIELCMCCLLVFIWFAYVNGNGVQKLTKYSILINFYLIAMSLVMVPICRLKESETRSETLFTTGWFRKNPWSCLNWGNY